MSGNKKQIISFRVEFFAALLILALAVFALNKNNPARSKTEVSSVSSRRAPFWVGDFRRRFKKGCP